MIIEVDGITVDLKVGADPEGFPTNGTKLLSAHGMVPGDKENPHKVSKGAIQVDGMALEFNIDPANNREEFIGNILQTISDLKANMPKGLDIAFQSTAEFGKEYIDSQPREARELGCSADYNAYEQGAENPKPNEELPFRTGAGHIHLGWAEGLQLGTEENTEVCCDVIKLMDLLVGVPSVLLDDDTKRRAMYGQAGAFRPKTYGAEYRTLSNFWLRSQELISWVYDQSGEAIKKYLEGFRLEGADALKVRKVINGSDKKGAEELVKKFNIKVPQYAS